DCLVVNIFRLPLRAECGIQHLNPILRGWGNYSSPSKFKRGSTPSGSVAINITRKGRSHPQYH
ncbi:MAG: hypothetical protein ACOYN8_18635, partial [Pseudanabaena sp.]